MTTTLNLREGDRVHVPATINSKAFFGTVHGVGPWVLGNGEQARQGRGKNGPLLWTVYLIDVETYGETKGYGTLSASPTDDRMAHLSERNMAVPVDYEWEVVTDTADPDAAREEVQVVNYEGFGPTEDDGLRGDY